MWAGVFDLLPSSPCNVASERSSVTTLQRLASPAPLAGYAVERASGVVASELQNAAGVAMSLAALVSVVSAPAMRSSDVTTS